MLLRLRAHTESPRWSSKVLEDLVEVSLRPVGAGVGDVVHALFDLLDETSGGPSETQANLAREIGVLLVGRHRRQYEAQDLSWLAAPLKSEDVTPPQAYFAAYLLPPALLVSCREPILRALAGTRFAEEVARYLEE
jgi:hypothetical protein